MMKCYIGKLVKYQLVNCKLANCMGIKLGMDFKDNKTRSSTIEGFKGIVSRKFCVLLMVSFD
jgi:hypothetical protein